MTYPKWLQEEIFWYYGARGELWRIGSKLIGFMQDAWDMAHNAGVEGAISPAEFCEKYGDVDAVQGL